MLEKIGNSKLFLFICKRWDLLLLISIFLLDIFLRFYAIETKSGFGYDQVDNAWAAKDIIVNHKFPLLGMVAKGNSGIFIGSLYYYLIAIAYWFTKLDPIASGIFAGITSIFTFWTIYFVIKKIFSAEVALIAVFLNTVSFYGILFDRVQWPVDFIPSISLIIFYSLYKILNGNSKYILLLTIAVGFSFHIHFTSVFYPMIILFTLPFFPKDKKTLKYILISIPLFLIWFIPNIISELQHKNSSGNLFKYLNLYYHGFHLRRVLQIAGDAFIQFEKYFYFNFLTPLKYFLLPLITIIYLLFKPTRKNLVLIYLIWLWFLIPWLVFSTYRGEISDYYFSINKFIVLIILSIIIAKILNSKIFLLKALFLLLLVSYAVININKYISYQEIGLNVYRAKVIEAIKKGEVIKFQQGNPESYLYYFYMKNNNNLLKLKNGDIY